MVFTCMPQCGKGTTSVPHKDECFSLSSSELAGGCSLRTASRPNPSAEIRVKCRPVVKTHCRLHYLAGQRLIRKGRHITTPPCHHHLPIQKQKAERSSHHPPIATSHHHTLSCLTPHQKNQNSTSQGIRYGMSGISSVRHHVADWFLIARARGI
jgi:hypothetical protein